MIPPHQEADRAREAATRTVAGNATGTSFAFPQAESISFVPSCQHIALILGLYVEESMSSVKVLRMPPPAVPWIEEVFRGVLL
jgi:hypothetical protein